MKKYSESAFFLSHKQVQNKSSSEDSLGLQKIDKNKALIIFVLNVI